MRKLFASLVLSLGLVAPAIGAGSIPVALSQQFSANGVPLVNCQLFIFVVGTVATPQNAFQDTALTNALPFPVTCDANGRLPMFYLADGSVHVRLTDASGVVQFDYPSMLVIGPSSGGGGGGGTPDPTTLLSTGDIKFRATSETLTGWVRLNGRTIGSATSGATERANADTQNLFIYLWQNCIDAHCPVGGGRGGSAAADFGANKQITLPDWRARIPVGLDDMGNSASGRLLASNITSGGGDSPTTPMATGGESNHSLVQAELPAFKPAITITDPGHTHTTTFNGVSSSSQQVGKAVAAAITNAGGGSNSAVNQTFSIDTVTTGTTAALTSNLGSGIAMNVMSPFALGTWFLKL